MTRNGKRKGGAMPEPWVKRFGDEVQFQREERHMRQADLAAATGYTAGMISQIESGVVTPSGDKIVRLARFLKLDLNRILGIRVEPAGGLFGLPETMGDPIMVRTLAMIDKVWFWPPEQRQAMVSVWRALATAVEEWPARTERPAEDEAAEEEPPPATDDGRGSTRVLYTPSGRPLHPREAQP
jgi:transcriptional regulator with XRE-family HTH domain